MNRVWGVKNGTVNVKPQSAGHHHRISSLLAFLFPLDSWSEIEFKEENSQEIILWWMKNGRKVMELKHCNHIDILKGVVPRLSACSVSPLFCPASAIPCPLFHFSCPPPLDKSPAFQWFYYAQYPVKNVFALFAGMMGCPGSANCLMSSSSWVCATGGSRRLLLCVAVPSEGFKVPYTIGIIKMLFIPCDK